MVENKGKESCAADLDKMQVVDSPKEIKILGQFSRVYIEGNELFQKVIFDRAEPQLSQGNQRKKQYVIIPIKDDNSVVEFIKVPIYKMTKKPKAKKIGTFNGQRMNPSGEIPLTVELDTWSAEKNELHNVRDVPSASKNQSETSTGEKEKSSSESETLNPEPKDSQKSDNDSTNGDSKKESSRLLTNLTTEKNKNKKTGKKFKFRDSKHKNL